MKKSLSTLLVVVALVFSGHQAQALFNSGLTIPAGAVLGDQTYQAVTIFKASNLTLTATPYSFDDASGKWNYQINWQRLANRGGSIYINGNVFVANASGSGSNFTGFSLNPGSAYGIIYYSQNNGSGVRIVNRTFTVLPAQSTTSKADVEDNQSNTASTQAHSAGTLVNDNGTIYLIVENGKLGIPDIKTFNSWNYSFGNTVAANSADSALPVIGVVTLKQPGQTTPPTPTPTPTPPAGTARVGQIVQLSDSTVYLVGQNGLYGFTTSQNYLSWGYSFNQVVPANAAEAALPKLGFVPDRITGCSSALDQIAGNCGATNPTPTPVPTPNPTPTPNAASIRVLSPNGGENWYLGSPQSVQWSSAGGDTVAVYLAFLDGGVCYLGTAQASAGNYLATVSSTSCSSLSRTVAAGQYKISLFLHKNGESDNFSDTGVANDSSDAPFNLLAPTTNAPRVGQLINNNGTVYLVGNGGLYGIPSLDIFNSWGWSFTQVMPANSAEMALTQIGVVPAKLPGCGNALDQIAGKCSALIPSTISIASPNGGEQWVAGSTHAISWTGGSGNVGIYLYHWSTRSTDATNGYANIFNIISTNSIPAVNGQFSWTIPSSTPADSYYVRLTDTAGGGSNSNAAFSIISGQTVPNPTLSVSLNSALASPVNLTLGGASQKVASFIISPNASDVAINAVALTSLTNSVGNGYQNLKVVINGSQVGTVQPTFSNNGTYQIYFSNPVIIPAGVAYTLDVYLDVSTTAYTLVNQNLVSLTSLSGYFVANNSIIPPFASVAGQGVFVPPQISIDKFTTSPNPVASGQSTTFTYSFSNVGVNGLVLSLTCPSGVSAPSTVYPDYPTDTVQSHGELCNQSRTLYPEFTNYSVKFVNTTGQPQNITASLSGTWTGSGFSASAQKTVTLQILP